MTDLTAAAQAIRRIDRHPAQLPALRHADRAEPGRRPRIGSHGGAHRAAAPAVRPHRPRHAAGGGDRRRPHPLAARRRRPGGGSLREGRAETSSLHVLDRLANAGAPLWGVVLNRVRPDRASRTTTVPTSSPAPVARRRRRSAGAGAGARRPGTRGGSIEADQTGVLSLVAALLLALPSDARTCRPRPTPNLPPTATFFFTPVAPIYAGQYVGRSSAPLGIARRRRHHRLLRLELRRRHPEGDDRRSRPSGTRSPTPPPAASTVTYGVSLAVIGRQGRSGPSPPEPVTVTELPAPTAPECQRETLSASRASSPRSRWPRAPRRSAQRPGAQAPGALPASARST